jgi:hypothetical protein
MPYPGAHAIERRACQRMRRLSAVDVTSQEIRALLASVEPATIIPIPPGYVAVLYERVEATRVDMRAVDAWVAERGGHQGRTNPIRSQGLQARRLSSSVLPGQLYYAIPTSALLE